MIKENGRRTRIAIIGAGAHARDSHYPALHGVDEIELCAACDLSKKNLNDVCERFHVQGRYTDYRLMIERENPDGVVVVLPIGANVPVVMDCLELGVSLLVEKPPAPTVDAACRMLELAHKKGCTVMVSLNRRFIPVIDRVRDLALSRGLVNCAMTYNKGLEPWPFSGSIPMCDGIHLIDLMRYVGGPVAEVYAHAGKRNADVTNLHGAMLVYQSGATGTVNNHQCVGGRVQRFEVHACELSAYLDLGNLAAVNGELMIENVATPLPETEEDIPPGIRSDSFFETRHFGRVLKGEETCRAELADVIESMRLAEAIAGGYRGEMSRFGQCSP